MSDKLDVIYDVIRDNHKESSERMTRIEIDLREHKEGVIQNRARIEKLEEPMNALLFLKKAAIWISCICAAGGAIYKALELL